jgi:hypothetical protein
LQPEADPNPNGTSPKAGRDPTVIFLSVVPVRDGTDHLRVLIANERQDRLALVGAIVMELGHEVIAREIDVEDVGPVTARERPDV